MKLNIIKKIMNYLFYFPFSNKNYRKSLWNVLVFKIKYEKYKYITFYDMFNVHYSFTKLLINKLVKDEKIILFVGEKTHPALKHNICNLKVIYISNEFQIFYKFFNISIFITPASNFEVKYKPKESCVVHIFHSIVSMHYIYGDGAFDAYDVFFAVGPHHIDELKRTERIRKWKNKIYLEIGYPKIEELVKVKNNKKNLDSINILFAPSWGELNLLKVHGIEIINKILSLKYNVIVRPHPHSFLYDIGTIEKIKDICKNNSKCILENSSSSSMDSYLKSDLMISDWSGAAYEYAFGLLKPVLFIDMPKKISRNTKEQIDYLPMEVICRERIGIISKVDDFESSLLKIITRQDSWKSLIEEVRKDYIFNPSNSISIAIKAIKDIKNGKYLKKRERGMINKVSILVATYNAERFIRETIDSCLKQSYKNVEIIVVDDCSSDGTVEILKSYGDKINLTINQTNQGIVKNFNNMTLGLKSDYFIFLGHDDILPKSHIEIMINEFSDDTVSIYCNSVAINENNEEIKLLLNDDLQIKKIKKPLFHLAIDNFINSCGMIHRTEIFKKIGGWDEKYKNYGEWLFYIKVLRYGNIKYSTKSKSKYRRHDTNITNSFKDKNVKKGLKNYFNECRTLAHNEGNFSLIEVVLIKIKLFKLYIINMIRK